MPTTRVQDIRNIALCGHGSAGKSTLIDHLLTMTGAIHRPADVDQGTSVCDFDEEEKSHHFSVESHIVHFDHGGKHFNLIDTPGYPDFIAQTLEAFRAVETAAIVINAHSGIEVNTRRVFQEAGKVGLGRMIIVDKMDTENVHFTGLLNRIQEMFGRQCIPLNVPIGQGPEFRGVTSVLNATGNVPGAVINPAELRDPLIESIIEVDEAVTERYFAGQQPTEAEIRRLIVQAVANGSLIPVMCVAGKPERGLAELLEGLSLCSLPVDAVARQAKNEDGGDVQLTPDANGPLVAQVFKNRIDPFVQKLSYIRVFSGTIRKDDVIHISGLKKNIKLTTPLEVQGAETVAVDVAGPGDIVAVAKMDDLHIGTTLGNWTLPKIDFPTPMVGLALTPKSRGDETKLSGALHKILEEDPTFRLDRDAQTHELVATGMSELHLSLIRERLKRRDKVEVDVHEPKVPYRETIQSEAEGSYRHKKQSGGRGQFGEVHIRLYPLANSVTPEEFCTKQRFPHLRQFHYDAAHHFLWVDSIVGGTIPNNFLPAIEKGFKERLDRGVIAGYQIQNVCVEVHFGKHHPVDSSEAAFKIAGSMAFRNVFQEAKPGLLEPIVNLHITVPSDKLGDINADLSGRRGRVLGMESAGGDLQTVTAQVPLSEVTNYARSLSSFTGGQGSYTMELSHYDIVPGHVQKEIIEKAVLHEEEDE